MNAPDGEGLELLGQLITANVAHATFLSDQLLAAKDDQIRALARTIAAMQRAIDEATVIDRLTERRLYRLKYEAEYAESLLEDIEAES